MLKDFLYFVKYNNFAVYIVLFIFVLSTGVFAQSDVGQEFIGKKNISQQGVDNTLLLDFQAESFDMNFKIEKIEEDEKYYYVTYTFLDLILVDNVWQYEIQEKIRKVSKKAKVDLGKYLEEELAEEYEARLVYLQEEKAKAELAGETKREEVIAYDGLIGKTLLAVDNIFPDYEAVVKKELPSPSVPATILPYVEKNDLSTSTIVKSDNITEIYNNFIAENDPDGDDVFGSFDNCPINYNPEQIDKNQNEIGDVCDEQKEISEIIQEEVNLVGSSTDEIINEKENLEIETEESEDVAELQNEDEEPSVEIIDLNEL